MVYREKVSKVDFVLRILEVFTSLPLFETVVQAWLWSSDSAHSFPLVTRYSKLGAVPEGGVWRLPAMQVSWDGTA